MGVVILHLGAGRAAAGVAHVRAAQRLEGVRVVGLFQRTLVSSRRGRPVEFRKLHRLFAAGVSADEGTDYFDPGRGALSHECGDEGIFRGAHRPLAGASVAELFARLQSD